jgi:hypothetical protein
MRFGATAGSRRVAHRHHRQSIGSNYGLTSQIFVVGHFGKWGEGRDGYLANSLILRVGCMTNCTPIQRLRRHYDENCTLETTAVRQQLRVSTRRRDSRHA